MKKRHTNIIHKKPNIKEEKHTHEKIAIKKGEPYDRRI